MNSLVIRHLLIFLIGLGTSVALRHGRCSLIANPGPCNGNFEMFAYDFANNVCVEFIYGGCGGNPNRFQTKKECILLCDALSDEDDEEPMVSTEKYEYMIGQEKTNGTASFNKTTLSEGN
ncbi:kunitz-type serine protease inhibitor mulgin-5 isoform X3 [Drosophila yakuba]|uniref:kunitz-type serine protease inhibitor mulgin-5 isoform X2 n=1 Tax=Drosophila yakuba TaxID=7245 RepID=UPI0019308634|nr:kunitz-type serine protease inhibitor mulgin-5 isoform X2 [Drosophila yakuba]XP_039231927.1 kunitz-type serine protease inhibitor mulgin-5 isoform X3 [Drosophila yakuba]